MGPAPISIVTDANQPAGSTGNCNAADAAKLQRAADCAMGQGDKCMADTNLAASLRLRAGILRGSLTIGCGSTCDPATTTVDCPVWKFGKCDSKMSVNAAQLAKMSEGEACAMMLHEMLHWVGVADAGGGDGGHDDGVDRVYACGRYCAGCVNTNNNTPAGCGVNRNSDCATCAGTKAEKKQCGTKQEVAQTSNNYSVCHAGLGCLLGKCEQPIGVNLLACDGKKLEDGPFLCCQACPADCNKSNDIPCTSTPPPVDSCNFPPPACSP